MGDTRDDRRQVRSGDTCYQCKTGTIMLTGQKMKPYGEIFQCGGCHYLFVNTWDGRSLATPPPDSGPTSEE